jgi:ABC-type branched-subunit amino acid transport system substrate-binding protein
MPSLALPVPRPENPARSPNLLRRFTKAAAAAALTLAIAACAGNPLGGGPRAEVPQAGQAGQPGSGGLGPRPDVRPSDGGGPPATGGPRSGTGVQPEGGGTITVGLLIPETGRSRDQLALGAALRDAAWLALTDSGRGDIQIVIKDTGGNASRAAAAASAAIREGADILLGPVFAEDVAAVGNVARGAGVPVIAFSSDNTVASPGVFLLSFPLEEEVRQIVNYSASRGFGFFAALVPANQYGRRAAMAYRDAVSRIGGEITASTTYTPGEAAYSSIMQLDGKQFDAIFVPDGGASMRGVANLLRNGPPPPPAPPPLTEEEIAAGKTPPPPPEPLPRANLPEYALIGTGLWDEGSTGGSASVAGGFFAAPETFGRERFSARFNGAFGYRPARIATLGYDALSLVAILSSNPSPDRFSYANIADPNGFSGLDGIYRFLPDGTIQRGLAILQVTGGGFQTVRSAPRSFQATGF